MSSHLDPDHAVDVGDPRLRLTVRPGNRVPHLSRVLTEAEVECKIVLITLADAAPFDPAKTITIDVTTFDELKVRVRMTERDGAFWIMVEASGGHEDAAKITARAKGWVYRITDYTASPFTRRMKDLVEDAKPKSRSN